MLQLRLVFPCTCGVYMNSSHTVRVKKKLPIPFTVLPFSVPFSASFRFPRRSVLPFRSPFYRFRSPFYRFTVPSTDSREAVIAGEYLEVLKLGATILMVDTYAEPFGEPPIRASGPSAATRAPGGPTSRSLVWTQLCRCNWSLSTGTPKS